MTRLYSPHAFFVCFDLQYSQKMYLGSNGDGGDDDDAVVGVFSFVSLKDDIQLLLFCS